MVSPPDIPARFGFIAAGTVVILDAQLRSGSDYGISVNSEDISEGLALTATSVTLWGVPAEAIHTPQRACPGSNGAFGCAAGVPPTAFLRMSTSCAGPQATTLNADSWTHPGVFATAAFTDHQTAAEGGAPQGATGCDQVPFEPSLEARPLSSASPGPSGWSFDLRVPQNTLTEPATIAQSDLRTATVTLPPGVRVSPSSADGLGACTPAQIDLHSSSQPSCPDASKLGTVTLDTPLLADPLNGAIYLATPHDNPSGALIGLYIVAQGPGVMLKLPGSAVLDPSTGQLSTTFDNNPQLPFSHLHLEFFGGDRAALSNPPHCGTYTTTSTLTGWSGKTVTSDSSFQTDKGPDGGACVGPRFQPSFQAGTAQPGNGTPTAGQFTPFTLRLQRSDADAEFASLSSLTLPPGLSASLHGTTYCPEATLKAADTPVTPTYTGAQALAAPSCPASSQIGTATIGAGTGPNPFYVTAGRVYLAGPYKGAPLSLAVSVAALAGPFDLGNVIVRSALYVNSDDASLRAVSDPFPTILQGIRLQVRDIRVNIDRPHFTLNPTNCEPMSINATALSTEGQRAELSDRFQVADCAALPFRPKLRLALRGATHRRAHPSLHAILTAKSGEANIARAQVKLPKAAFLDNAHIGAVCTRVQFSAHACPPASVYGYAKAVTPLLDAPLQGPVYLRSSSHQLPDLIADLGGQIEVALAGRTDSVKGALRNTFEAVPDAPVTKFSLTLFGGKRGLIELSSGFCKAPRAAVDLTAQNGKVHDTRPVVGSSCPKKHKARTSPGAHR
jgi:hypothetical protein